MPRESIELKRGWTFAMAMADEVTDEVLVEQLEKMRNGPSSHNFSPSVAWMQHSSKHGDSTTRTRSISSVHPHPHVMDRAHTERINSDLEDAATWRTARRALLCCREMVRTEKRYQEELKALLNGEVRKTPSQFYVQSPITDMVLVVCGDIDNNAPTSSNANLPPCPPTRIRSPAQRSLRGPIGVGRISRVHGL